jgi:hypothetical protein
MRDWPRAAAQTGESNLFRVKIFKVRREDMRRLPQATDGKVFTLTTMHFLIDHTRIREYRST